MSRQQHQESRVGSSEETGEKMHELLTLASQRRQLLNAQHQLHCELIATTAPTDEIWVEWRQLMLQAPETQQLFGPEWFRTWADTWGADGHWTGQTSLITARNTSGMLVGLLALGRPRIGPVPVHSFGGHSAPHRGIVAAFGLESMVGSAIGKFIADRNWPFLQIGPVLKSDPACQAMIQELQEQNVFLRHHDSREEITLHAPDTWEEYCREFLSHRQVRRLGSDERRICRAGNMNIRHYRRPSPDETANMFVALKSIEAHSWMATRPDAVPRFTNEALLSFWHRLTDDCLSPRDHLDCWVMTLDERPVSFCFTLTCGSIRYVIANNYDNSVRRFKTGSVLYRHMIQNGIERGIRRFEFADGSLHYKSRWGAEIDGSRDTWIAVPGRFPGWAASVISRLTPRLCTGCSPSVPTTNDNTPR